MYAAIARKAGAGQRRPPTRGFITDVQTISAYLPYCDAMFVDDECRGLLSEEPLKSRLGYPTRIFSTRTWNDLLSYLDAIEATCTPEHRALVREVYGADWERPFETMYSAVPPSPEAPNASA